MKTMMKYENKHDENSDNRLRNTTMYIMMYEDLLVPRKGGSVKNEKEERITNHTTGPFLFPGEGLEWNLWVFRSKIWLARSITWRRVAYVGGVGLIIFLDRDGARIYEQIEQYL